jgi:hypothetical protein
MMTDVRFLLLLVLCYTLCVCVSGNSISMLEEIQKSIDITDQILGIITSRWDINNYPLFVKSGYMSVRSWKLMQAKFAQKIVSVALSPGSMGTR